MHTFGTGLPTAIETQTPSGPHGFVEQESSLSHDWPVKPAGQSHLYVNSCGKSIHLPLFMHGFEEQPGGIVASRSHLIKCGL
jgi:hypothetical protein